MADQKLNSNINLGEMLYLEVPDITDCKLLHYSQINNTSRINKINKIK